MNLAHELSLIGKVMCLVRGGTPVDSIGGLIFVDEGWNIQFVEEEDFEK